MARRRKRKRELVDTIGREDLSIRDELMLRLINGATKAGIEKDRKKEQEKYQARKKVRSDED